MNLKFDAKRRKVRMTQINVAAAHTKPGPSRKTAPKKLDFWDNRKRFRWAAKSLQDGFLTGTCVLAFIFGMWYPIKREVLGTIG